VGDRNSKAAPVALIDSPGDAIAPAVGGGITGGNLPRITDRLDAQFRELSGLPASIARAAAARPGRARRRVAVVAGHVRVRAGRALGARCSRGQLPHLRARRRDAGFAATSGRRFRPIRLRRRRR
jgi:hypothetical protein